MARACICRTCILLLICVLSLVSGKDYYQLLGLQRGASDQQMKKVYRKLALQYHPDKVTGTTAEKEAAAKRFAEINHAYEVLSDPKKRRIYDQYGEEGLKQQGGDDVHDAGDIFSQFFGGFGGFGGQQEEERTPRGDDVVVTLEATLRDVYVGKHIKLSRTKAVYKPAAGKRQCNCRAKMVTKQIGPGMFQQYQQQVCEECQNVKLVRDSVDLTVDIEPGMPHNHVITVFEEGEPHADGDAGDLKLVLNVLPHPAFRRDGHNLHYAATISLLDALVGFKKEITHLDGHKVQLDRSDVTIPGQVVRIQGQGMPIYGDELRFGDLIVTYTIAFPEKVTDKQKEALKTLLA